MAALAVAVVLSGLIAFGSPLGVDYLAPKCEPYLCDDAGYSIEALSHGDVGGFFAEQPPMGSFSLLVRTPFAAVANAAGGGDLLVYRLGALACVLALAGLALAVGFAMARRGRPPVACMLVPAGILASPVTYAALKYGHPEELLAAALCVGAAVAAGRGRSVAAGLMLGCAVATKQWALLAALPVLLAAPRGRLRLTAVAGAAVALLVLPMMAADWDRFWLAQKSVGIATTFDNTVTASNVWFAFAKGVTAPTMTPEGMVTTTQYSLPHWLGHLTHPLVALLALAAVVAFWLRRRGAGPEEALQLMALIFLLRCVLDPLTYSYHHAPFVVSLVAYEGLRRRVPVMSGVSIAALLLMTEVVAPMKNAGLINAFYLSWSLPMTAALALGALAPARLDALASRVRGLVRPAAAPAAPAA
ncbi:MAG TPA: glycosyltransferase 87 family protein [Thermoleophilaceae bacterium]